MFELDWNCQQKCWQFPKIKLLLKKILILQQFNSLISILKLEKKGVNLWIFLIL